MTDDRLDTLYRWLCDRASVREPCPTNREISDRFGARSVSSAARLVGKLEDAGRITVKRVGRTGRVVTIAETGDRTAAPAKTDKAIPKSRHSIAMRQAMSQTAARKRENSAIHESGVGEIARYAAPPLTAPKRCQWIPGEPTADDDCKCLAPAVPGWPYCPDNLRRAYQWGKGQGADEMPGAVA